VRRQARRWIATQGREFERTMLRLTRKSIRKLRDLTKDDDARRSGFSSSVDVDAFVEHVTGLASEAAENFANAVANILDDERERESDERERGCSPHRQSR